VNNYNTIFIFVSYYIMSSILNLFSNFTDLTKTKSVTDNVSNYEIEPSNSLENTPSVSQGIKFKKYQGYIINNLEQKIQKTDLIEGFDNLYLDKNGLTHQTNNVIRKNDFSSQKQTVDNLKLQHANTLEEYNKLSSQISENTTRYIDRVNPNNPYLGKVIKFQNGNLCYVTQHGVAKWFPTKNIYLNNSGKNGFPPEGQFITLPLKWSNNYQTPGAIIPTTPQLISGTPIGDGEGVGNEGSNVYVNSIVKNPIGSYIGCYNNLSPVTGEIMFSPKMNSSNNVNGYVSAASSVFQNNSEFAGSWRAFDQNKDTCWNSGVYSEIDRTKFYDKNNGNYIGQNTYDVKNRNGSRIVIKGESLQLNLPKNIPLTRYELQGSGNSTGTDPGTWYVIGYNGTQTELVDFRENEVFNLAMKSFNVSNPKPYSNYMIVITMVGDPKASAGSRTSVQIGQWNLYTGNNSGSTTPAMKNTGKMTFEQCLSYSLNSDNKYFGLQSVDNNGVGNCMVSNDLAGSQIYGKADKYNMINLWCSRTKDKNGVYATLTDTGSLSILTNGGQTIYSTPGQNKTPSNYLGCYADRKGKAMVNTSKNQYESLDKCKEYAIDGNYKYYAGQNTFKKKGVYLDQCFASNDLSQVTKFGLSKSCRTIDNVVHGGPSANAVYSVDADNGKYFLILQDDGNMCIYRGSSPSDNQGFIWGTNSKGKQKNPNPNFSADKSKYGKNWISIGATLAQGEFIGSTNGSIYLIMQADGNLCLYTSTMSNKCLSSSKAGNKTVGAQDTNALYQINNMGYTNLVDKLAYIDENSELHPYPSQNQQYSDSYSQYNGIDSNGSDIPGASYGNSSVEKCKKSCNSIDNCAGFTISNNVCYPKSSLGVKKLNKNVNLYSRNKSPKRPPIGVPKTVTNIDSIAYYNYKNGGKIGNSYGLANVTSAQKSQLSQLQTRLDLLTSEINKYTDKFDNGSNLLNNQANKNIQGLGDYLKDFEQTNNNIKNFNTNIENILNDSDITVLQKNYDYLFWSILATGTVLVTMNIAKKE
jgi:hypothetical protein